MSKKIFSLREHYDFSAVDGTRLGEGDGNLFQLPARFVVLDSNKAEVMHIVGKVLSIRHEYALFDNAGNNFGSIKKKIMKLIGEEYWLEQNGVELMRIHGDFTEHDYRMEINKRPVAAVHKKWISIRDQFSISITGQVDPRLVIGSAIVVEHIEVTERQNKSGSGFGIRFL